MLIHFWFHFCFNIHLFPLVAVIRTLTFSHLLWSVCVCHLVCLAKIISPLSSRPALGAAYGTAKSGTGIAAMSVMRPELIMKSIIPVVMAGIIAIYGLVVAVLIANNISEKVTLYKWVQLNSHTLCRLHFSIIWEMSKIHLFHSKAKYTRKVSLSLL